jgi:hypothetical protein
MSRLHSRQRRNYEFGDHLECLVHLVVVAVEGMREYGYDQPDVGHDKQVLLAVPPRGICCNLAAVDFEIAQPPKLAVATELPVEFFGL